MAIDEGRIREAAEGFAELLRRCFGPDAELKMLAVVGVVEDGDGELEALWNTPPAGGRGTAWVLRAAADAMEAGREDAGGEPRTPLGVRLEEGRGVVFSPGSGARYAEGRGIVLGEGD